MIRHVDCNCILGATEEDVDKLFPDGSCIGYCPNKDCSRGLFGTDQGNGTYDDALAVAESRSRFKDEVLEALEDVPSHIKEPASSNGIFYDEASFNAGYRLAKQKSIETIKKL